ncbi:hypothetical protein L1D34_07230 [Vibrio mediterranei]|uniref:hypothetical protein n=1 Tax=Vibrio mediterranei TaxID=689 RepID=UPI001EFCAD89|nr:hypothetical protein [Vibrio mediterranei]MCG9624631.1 hypothetical protein [Vibrio mediterranei]
MKYLNQAIALSRQDHVTLNDLRTYDALLAKARGDEANQIGDLYSTLISLATPEDYAQFIAETETD